MLVPSGSCAASPEFRDEMEGGERGVAICGRHGEQRNRDVPRAVSARAGWAGCSTLTLFPDPVPKIECAASWPPRKLQLHLLCRGSFMFCEQNEQRDSQRQGRKLVPLTNSTEVVSPCFPLIPFSIGTWVRSGGDRGTKTPTPAQREHQFGGFLPNEKSHSKRRPGLFYAPLRARHRRWKRYLAVILSVSIVEIR